MIARAVDLAVRMALGAVTLTDIDRFRRADLLGKPSNGLNRHLRDGARPFGGFRRHVIAGSHDVVFVGLVLPLGAFGHRLLIIADAVFVQEFLVDPAVVDHLVGERRAQRAVGAGANGHPCVPLAAQGVVHAGVDDDDLDVFLFQHPRQVVGVAAAAHARVGRTVPEHDDDLVVLKREEVARVRAAAIGVKAGPCDMRGAVGPVIVQMAAGEVHEPVHHAIAHKARRDAGGVVHRHGLVAVGLANALHLACDGVDSLVPADLLELARSALADALHGIVQAIGALKPPTDGTPPQAGAQLGLVHCGIARVIGFHIRYLLVAHMALQRAGAAAIDRAMRPNDSVLGRSPFGFPLGLRSRRTAEHGRASRSRRSEASQGRTLHERTARYGVFICPLHLVPPSSVEVFRRCGARCAPRPLGERARGTRARTFSPSAFAIGENLTPQPARPVT